VWRLQQHGVLTMTLLTTPDYPDANFTKIQDAVDAASGGDTIIVYPGIYTENVDVNKRLAYGERRDNFYKEMYFK